LRARISFRPRALRCILSCRTANAHLPYL